MKKNLLYQFLLFSFTFIFATSIHCDAQKEAHESKKSNTFILFPRKRTTRVVINNPNDLPPGQAKKIYGTKSAKPFAPGQRKKHYRNSWPNYQQHERGDHDEEHGNKKEKHDHD